MKTTRLISTLALIVVMMFTACQDENELTLSQPVTELSTSVDSNVVVFDSSNINGPMRAKAISSSMILKASSYSKIPVYFYKVDSRYKSSYQHLKQPSKSDRCSWTTYVTTVGCIVNVDNVCRYDVSQSKVDKVMSKCESIGGSHDNAKKITVIESFARRYDKQYISVDRPSVSNRLSAIKEMLYHIYTYRTPFQVINTYYNNVKRIGHYLIVFSIDWSGDPKTSTIYYTDPTEGKDFYPLSFVLKSMNYNKFLDGMIDVPATYNMLFFIPS